MPPRERTGAQIIWECLVHEGVTTVFGYPGGAILPAYDAMLDYPIRHVLVRHEQGASHMADGYAGPAAASVSRLRHRDPEPRTSSRVSRQR
jgi:glyoxylate carboligase